MPNPTPSNLTSCDEGIPLLGITREFDFGQFIELFESSGDPPIISRIVIQPSSTLAAESNATIGPPSALQPNSKKSTQKLTPLKPAHLHPQFISSKPEVHLFDLIEHGPSAKLTPVPIEIKDRDGFIETGKVELKGKTYKVELDSSMREAMAMGLAVTVFAAPTEESGASIPLKLSLPFMQISLDKGKLSKVLTGDGLDTTAGSIKPVLTADAIRVLLNGGTVLTHGVDAKEKKTPLELYGPGPDLAPMSDRFDIFDLPSFIAKPAIWAMNGALLAVDLESEHVDQLITTGRTQIKVSNHSIELHVNTDKKSSDVMEFRKMERNQEGGRDKELVNVKPPGPVKPPSMTWEEMREMIESSLSSDGTINFVNPAPWEAFVPPDGKRKDFRPHSSLTDRVQPRLPSGSGLPVAVFVPWKQTWTLKGFSRGNLLHSIALAPLEQLTLQVFSWERRSRSLEQSSETDIDQQTEVTQTTRDTEDVFREMIAKHDFAWQLSGSLDASYNNGVASIEFNSNGSVSNTDSIQQTARNSSQHLKESTVKATSRVHSRRVTKITQSVESGREERVTRLIRNPNQCHTLTFDFFETLANYEISLQFIKERLRLVVLIPNPISYKDFSSEIIRRNETTFRNALIEPALVDGFDACRMIAAYTEAKSILSNQKSEAERIDEPATQRTEPAPTGAPDPAAPQEAEVKRVVDEMVAALKKIRGDAEIDTALVSIRDHSQVSEAARSAGQHWLFINFCAAKLSNALLAILDELTTGSTPTLTAAQKILAVLPRPDAPTNLGNLNQMSDREKEDSCIASKLREEQVIGQRVYMANDWDWAWWTGRLREEGLYTSNDAGLGGLADQLQKAYQAWEAKKIQGAAMKDQEVAKTEAEGRQNKATTDDKLSMAFPLDELARAYERSKVLRDHLGEHREFYNYALFQALPPSEQALRIVEASNGRLQVGLFEPRVVAMNGSRLVVPLTPLAGSQKLKDFVSDLADDLEDAFNNASQTPDTTILPTPGVTVSSRLGKCNGCEEYIVTAREHELSRLEALAQQEQYEAQRRQKRIEAKNYDDFREPPSAVKLEIENKARTP